jgi:hypothetical protein
MTKASFTGAEGWDGDAAIANDFAVAYVGPRREGYNPHAPARMTSAKPGPLAENRGRPMKIHMDVDLTPDEARTLFGLPDVKPMQQAMMAQVEARMKKALTAMEPDAILKTWLPVGIQGLEQWQKFIWSQMTGGGSTPREADADKAS